MSAPQGNRRPKRARAEPKDRSDRDNVDTEPSGEDLMGSDMGEDYRDADALNEYEDADLDAREYRDLNVDERRAAEESMKKRDRREQARRGVAVASDSEDGEGEEEEEEGFRDAQRRRRTLEKAEDEGEGGADEPFDISAYPATIKTLQDDKVRAEVRRRFYRFLTEFTSSSGEKVHDRLIADMVASNGASLCISYLNLSTAHPTFSIWLADVPRQMLELFDEVAKTVVLERAPDYAVIRDTIHVRVTHLPIEDKIRDLRQTHLSMLVKVSGVVTKRTSVFPQLKLVVYNCGKCGTATSPMANNSISGEVPTQARCPECQAEGPFSINAERTVYRNYQKLTLQESPGSVPAGRVPRYKEVILLADLIDAARPGEEIEVTGIYTNQFDASLNAKNGFPVFATLIEANFIQKRSDAEANNLITDDDMLAIQALKEDPNIVQRIAHAVAPSIYGHSHVKMAVAMAMFGGREKNINNKHRIRGDINVLLLGDPGTAKSQMLKYVEKTAPRCVYTTGKGASAVGLTAAVTKDPITGEWQLEGGALVLADRGVCCIDEFDKMTDQDRTSIHEAMEQQSISISKAGIVTTLQARCAVIAAANPIGGRYDASKSLSENVLLTDPILTRFDCLCVLRDEVDPVADERLANFVMNSHVRSHPLASAERARKEEAYMEAKRVAIEAGMEEKEAEAAAKAAATGSEADGEESEIATGTRADEGVGAGAASAGAAATSTGAGAGAGTGVGTGGSTLKPIEQSLLRKYILYARERVKPDLGGIDSEKVARLYSELRREAEVSSGVPIAVRHIESILRMAEAAAKMRHSSHVSDTDLNLAIRTQLTSFISAQKIGTQRSLTTQFERYLNTKGDYNTVLLVKLRELANDRAHRGLAVQVKKGELLDAARRNNITDIRDFLTSEALSGAGFVYDEEAGVFTRERDAY